MTIHEKGIYLLNLIAVVAKYTCFGTISDFKQFADKP